MAAAELERVRVSAAELRRGILAAEAALGRGGPVETTKEPRHRKDNRRPDLEIYKPGLSRLRNKHTLVKQEPTGHGEAKGKIAEDRASSVAPPDEASLPEDWCPRIIRRAKKPDQQIYQPGKRLQNASKDPAVSQPAVKESPIKGERDEEPERKSSGGCRKQVVHEGREESLNKEGAKPVLVEKGKRSERVDRARKGSDEMAHGKLSTPKRYSRSDKRRNRYRTCSTSSAGSNNSTDGARGEMEVGKKRQELAKERPRPRKQLSASSTDSLEDDRAEEAEVQGPSRDPETKRHLEHGWPSRTTDGKEAKASQSGRRTANRELYVTEADWCKRKPSGASLSDSAETGEGRGSSREPQGSSRGILVLPANTDLTASSAGSPEAPHSGPRLLFGSGSKGVRGRGRGGTVRRLWDPNNPDQKPALKNQTPQLHFLDTDDEVTPVPRNDTRQAQSSYYRFQNSDNPYYYGRSVGQGPPYPYAGYSLPYQVGASNGIYPGAYYPAGYPSQVEPYLCSPLQAGPLSTEMEQQVRSLQQQELSKVLREASNLEQQLSNLLSRDRLSPEGLEKMGQLRLEAYFGVWAVGQKYMLDASSTWLRWMGRLLPEAGFYGERDLGC
ncbi:hypothetical protein lerEdw1_002688 [Lerista edwardsae]|nr:hypothetical protein lerEdw1_002688 [Lerista edwardsae]